jgi:hypothetical protein
VPKAPEGTFLAYDPAKPEKDGLTAAEVVTYKLPQPRPVSYAKGIFMTAGQHKGIMLLTLLKDASRDIKAVIYVDDNVKHAGNVFSAAVDRNLDVSSFHYQREDTRVQRFNYSDKKDVARSWKAIAGDVEGKPDVAVVGKSPPRKIVVRRHRGLRARCCR